MLSSIFIDRPRLSIVISLVITIAGADRDVALPIAQFPDIVPPQVQVTARYPGAGADGGRADGGAADRVAGHRRRQDALHEVDQPAMTAATRSPSASPSAPTRTSTPSTSRTACSWRCRSCPRRSARQGVTVKKKSSAILQVLAVYSPDQRYDTLFLSNYATIKCWTASSASPASVTRTLFGALDYSMRVWLEHRPDDGTSA